MNILKIAATAALIAGGSTMALAQAQAPTPNTTNKDSPSKAQPGAPEQGPGKQTPSTGAGSRPIGPPADTQPAPGNNPTGMTKEKTKSEQDDPSTGGKKK